MSAETEIKAVETKIGVLLTAHHIVLYVLLGLAISAGIYLFQSGRADRAEAKADAAVTALAVEKDHSAQLAALYATNEAAREKDREQLAAAVTQNQAQAKIQIVHDQALLAPQLANRIDDMTAFKQGTTTLDPSQNLVVPVPVAKVIVAKIDQGTSDADTVVKYAATIKSQTDTINDQTAIIASDKTTLAKQIETDTLVLNAAKAVSRKSKLKWFFAGFVTGFVSREIIKP